MNSEITDCKTNALTTTSRRRLCEKDDVEKKPATSSDASLAKARSGILSSLCGGQVAKRRTLRTALPYYDERLHDKHELIRKKKITDLKYYLLELKFSGFGI